MVIIETPSITNTVENWKDQLLEMSVGHEIKIQTNLEIPQLTHNNEFYQGKEEIDIYIKKLQEFMSGWCRCACED